MNSSTYGPVAAMDMRPEYPNDAREISDTAVTMRGQRDRWIPERFRPVVYHVARMLDTVDIHFLCVTENPADGIIVIHYEVLRPFTVWPSHHGFPCHCKWGMANRDYYPYACFYERRSLVMPIPDAGEQ